MQANTKMQVTTALALGSAVLLLLPGCAGSSGTASGTYYGQTGKGSDPAIITVDGDTVTWGDFGCDTVGEIDMDDSDTSIGTLDKTRTSVAWTQEGRYSNTDPFTESEDGSVITMSGGTYSKAGTDAGDALLAEREDTCAEKADAQEKRETAQAEQAEADAKIKPAFDKALAALLKAGQSGDFSGADSIFANSGITADEFAGYLERNYNGLSADEFFSELQYNPERAELLLEEMKG
ncbi:hypothetical protein [Leucobacter luti]|uniref:DUF4476 domain-containing protein n=1 Tax=Leucobacter luti TaxID=340320 RepID=A0A4Q7TIP2_9MICO|nr:hypothetical protein [Leucobacter luti]MBL3700358.1 hypothetical protein [Leucobacter luti]RZT60526.1 hypothetical protein EV139_2971 [Leucobacter luti]